MANFTAEKYSVWKIVNENMPGYDNHKSLYSKIGNF